MYFTQPEIDFLWDGFAVLLGAIPAVFLYVVFDVYDEWKAK